MLHDHAACTTLLAPLVYTLTHLSPSHCVFIATNAPHRRTIALTPFEGMCGFRVASELAAFLASVPELKAVVGEKEAGAFIAAADGGWKMCTPVHPHEWCSRILLGCWVALTPQPHYRLSLPYPFTHARARTHTHTHTHTHRAYTHTRCTHMHIDREGETHTHIRVS